MLQITFNNLTFHYETTFQNVFDSLSMIISGDWKSALIGRNGRGKTTLFRLITGVLKPVSGTLQVPFEVKYFPFSPPHPQEITRVVIKESIAPFASWEKKINELSGKTDDESIKWYSNYFDLFMYNDGYTIDALIEKEAGNLGLDIDILNRPFNSLSGGEKTRALILSVFLKKDCFPLIDEPTDHLDLGGREYLAEFLAGNSKGFIVASHDRFLLDRCADHIISINKSGLKIIKGNYSTWRYQSDVEEEFEKRRNVNLQREIDSLEKAASQRRKWSDKKEKEKARAYDRGYIGHKAAKLMKRATAIEKRISNRIEDKKGLLKDYEKDHSLKMKQTGKLPDRVISINDLAVDINGKEIFSGIYLNVYKGDRLAITGKNGSGKTTLLNAIDGKILPGAGEIFIAPAVKISRAYQEPLWQNGFLKDHLAEEEIDMTEFRFIMSAFKMTGEIFDRPLETFSKGQQRKIDICRTLISPQLLIWDEPLNYLDIASREQIEDFLLEQQPTIIFVEHDRVFIESVATEVIELE